MPTPADELLYIDAVEWINKNPKDERISENVKEDFLNFNKLRPEKKIELIITLNKLLETTGLPEKIAQSLPWMKFDVNALPNELILKIKDDFLNESAIRSLGGTSRTAHSFFELPKRLLDKFLQRVAYGEQHKVEALFTKVYQGDVEKIQQALLHEGRFTDYSGRTFNCTAYEYAYWAKDTHMCRMLEHFMDDATKAIMLERVKEIERTGLPYIQDGVAYCTHHFDFSPLIQALRFYVENHEAWSDTNNRDAIEAAWMAVGKVQRDVPAHVAHEYSRPDYSFCVDRTGISQEVLPRVLTFTNVATECEGYWYPLTTADSGLGFNYAVTRGGWPIAQACSVREVGWTPVFYDLGGMIRLNEERTSDLVQSRQNLSPPALSQTLSV